MCGCAGRGARSLRRGELDGGGFGGEQVRTVCHWLLGRGVGVFVVFDEVVCGYEYVEYSVPDLHYKHISFRDISFRGMKNAEGNVPLESHTAPQFPVPHITGAFPASMQGVPQVARSRNEVVPLYTDLRCLAGGGCRSG